MFGGFLAFTILAVAISLMRHLAGRAFSPWVFRRLNMQAGAQKREKQTKGEEQSPHRAPR